MGSSHPPTLQIMSPTLASSPPAFLGSGISAYHVCFLRYGLLLYCRTNTQVPSGRRPGTADIPPRTRPGASQALGQIPSSIHIKSIPVIASGPPSGMFSAGASCPWDKRVINHLSQTPWVGFLQCRHSADHILTRHLISV